jgi:Tol biopolymer transport system component
MRPRSGAAMIVLVAIAQQSCTRDTAMAPHLHRLSSQLAATSPGRIAFSSNRNGYSSIYVMLPDGTGVTQLTDSANDAYPSWSPDGLKSRSTQVAMVSVTFTR